MARYWGRRGAGLLFKAADTGRILFPLRSAEVNEPGTWGTWGGAMDEESPPREAALREAREEGIRVTASQVVPLVVFRDEDAGFEYHNFLAVVPEEFEPDLNWETEDFRWVKPGLWPRPLHPGVKFLLADKESKRLLMQSYDVVAVPSGSRSNPPRHIASIKGALAAAKRLQPRERAAVEAYAALLRERVPLGAFCGPKWDRVFKNLAEGGVSELEEYIAEERAELPALAAKRTARAKAEADEEVWDAQAYSIPDPLTPYQRGKLRGKLVWVYHGTSDSLLPEILRRGLDVNPPKKTWQNTTGGYVYIATTPAEVEAYAKRAAYTYSGFPVVLRIILPFDELRPDLDDKDLPGGKRQFRTKYTIPPEQFFSVLRAGQEERLREPAMSPPGDADFSWKYTYKSPADDGLLRKR